MKRTISMRATVFCCLILLMCLPMRSATLDEVRALVESGKYEMALDAVEPLLKKSPRDGATNYWYGRARLGLGDVTQGLTAMRTAAERGYLDAYGELTDYALEDYDVDGARNYIEDWRAALTKAKKNEPAELDDLENRLVLMSNQLNRVEDIAVIARYDILRADFVKALDEGEKMQGESTVFINGQVPLYISNSSREIFWTEQDKDGISRLYSAGILDDGTRDETLDMTRYVGEGNIVAPFMMPDGETLYFAAERPDGLGGYDIYMTRRDDEGGFYEPSNIGMPYNSPADDMLFVIDEPNNMGWWVTDRFIGPDSLSVLVFVPSASRVNVPAGHESLIDRAFITNISLTQPDGFDVNGALSRIPKFAEEENVDDTPPFALSLGNGRVITDMAQFRSAQAASAMDDVIDARLDLDTMREQLDAMRIAYKGGKKSLKGDIRNLEAELERKEAELRKLTNRVVQLETTARSR